MMALSFSVQDHSSLFGVGFNPNTHLERLQAAECFYQVRKDIEKTKTRLASLTARDFKKKSLHFRTNLQDAIKEGPEAGVRRFLLPIFQDNCTTEGIWLFLLACLTLTDQQCKKLKKASLISIFPQLLSDVAGAVAIPSETRTAIIECVQEICVEVPNHSSRQLLG
jgi:hypothetical protein